MLKFSKFGLLIALVALCATAVSSASAADWKTNGPVAFTGTVPLASPAGNNSLLKITRANGTSVTLGCVNTSGSGTLNASPAAGTNPWLAAATITPAFSTCKVAATPFTVNCGVATLRTGVGPGAYAGGTTLALSDGGVTQGTIASISCVLSIGTPCVTVTGSVSAYYTNPVDATSTTGSLTVKSTGQALTASGTGCAAIPTGTAQFGAANPAFGDLTYNVTAPSDTNSQPRIWYGT